MFGLPRTSNSLGFDMGLVAIICPICVHVGFTRPEQLPRVLTCSRCHHQQNFSRPVPRQRPTEANQYASENALFDNGASTFRDPGTAIQPRAKNQGAIAEETSARPFRLSA
jgi:hypothetical protein